MDKAYKAYIQNASIPQADWITVFESQLNNIDEVIKNRK